MPRIQLRTAAQIELLILANLEKHVNHDAEAVINRSALLKPMVFSALSNEMRQLVIHTLQNLVASAASESVLRFNSRNSRGTSYMPIAEPARIHQFIHTRRQALGQ